MKKVLLVVVALASTNAFATRARVNALGNSPHLVDTQTVYSNPADMMIMGDYVTMESGTTAGGACTETENNFASGPCGAAQKILRASTPCLWKKSRESDGFAPWGIHGTQTQAGLWPTAPAQWMFTLPFFHGLVRRADGM